MIGIVAVLVVLCAAAGPVYGADGPAGPTTTRGGPRVPFKGCIVFEHANFRGAALNLQGNVNLSYVGDSWANTISSFVCAFGCRMTFFAQRDFKGTKASWGGGVAFVGAGWNDRISSLFVTCSGLGANSADERGCTVYQKRNYKGEWLHLGPRDRLQMTGEPCAPSRSQGADAGHIRYAPAWNDRISSFKLTPACTITLWANGPGCGGGGERFRSGKSLGYVGDRWNNQASHVECNCR